MRIQHHLSRTIVEEINDHVANHSLSIISLNISDEGIIKSYFIEPFTAEYESVEYHDRPLLVRVQNDEILFSEIG